jgi:hypothetical protein
MNDIHQQKPATGNRQIINGLWTDYHLSMDYHMMQLTGNYVQTSYVRIFYGLQVFCIFLDIQCALGDSVSGKTLRKFLWSTPKTLRQIQAIHGTVYFNARTLRICKAWAEVTACTIADLVGAKPEHSCIKTKFRGRDREYDEQHHWT